MDCEVFQAQLPDLIYGELESVRKQAAEGHAAGCPQCQGLLSDLRGVRDALPTIKPPPTLGTRLKLTARDQLIDEKVALVPAHARGGSLHLAVTGILAGCVCLAGFTLGIAYERTRPAPSDPALPAQGEELPPLDVPKAPADLGAKEEPEWIEINDKTGGKRPSVPRRSAAWQRVLLDAGRAALKRGKPGKARQFFLRAAAVDPDGSLTSAAQVSAAEALLQLGEREKASQELEATRRAIIAGTRYGNAALLQRITELRAEATKKN